MNLSLKDLGVVTTLQRVNRYHSAEKTVACRMQLGNRPLESKLKRFNIHLAGTESNNTDYSFRMTNLVMKPNELKELPTPDLENPENKPLLCLICNKRVINVVFLPCGDMRICSNCLLMYASYNCAACGERIRGYTKGIVT